MPIYEYEPVDRDCFICEGRVQAIQSIHEEPLVICPWCGLDVKKIVSRASFEIKTDTSAESAAKQGFTTFKRSEKGVWEKLAGEGADYIVGSQEDIKSVEEEKKPKPKVLDLDSLDK